MIATANQSLASWRSLFRHSDLLLALLVVAVIALMILPLQPFMLDTLIAVNLSMSVVLLMVALYVNSPLGLSTFPSLLLFTTLFRLALNIASTRQILLHANAGEIIFTFGNLVVGGDIIVGVVVFLIIAIVQFIVIAKGAERVAEVGARFTLDAMPGKQMSIDADLRAGIIDKEEARLRRSLLERESHLYGAMDGAMKFVKGDAIAALIIAAVNIIAGLAIGTLRRGMDLGAAVSTYSVLAVGDALVSQIPSLLVSIAAGILITRVSDPARLQGSGLGDEIAGQIRSHPKALLIGSAVICGLILVPGFPKLQFLGLAAIVGVAGYRLLPGRRRYRTRGETPMPALRREGTERIRPWLDASDHALTVPVTVQVFPAIEQSVDPVRLDQEILKVRRFLELDLGLPFPGIVMRTMSQLANGAYRICIHEVPVQDGEGELRPAHLLAFDSQILLSGGGIRCTEGEVAMLGRPAVWVHENERAQLDRAQRRYLTLEQALAQHLRQVLQKHADELIGIQEAQLLLKRLADEHPDLEKELQRNVPLPRFTEVLKRLVREDISIRNLRDIAHGLIEWGPREKDTVLLTEYVRTCLSRYISHRFSNRDGTLSAVVLHPSMEDRLRQSIRQTSAGTVLLLDPETTRQLAAQIKEMLLPYERQANGGAGAVLLTSLEIRPYLRKLTETELGRVPVLSYQELNPAVRIKSLAAVR
ncbi:MAG: type III secretion system export apparatus subunit SctV [Steroidobacteraceae bacterium]